MITLFDGNYSDDILVFKIKLKLQNLNINKQLNYLYYNKKLFFIK